MELLNIQEHKRCLSFEHSQHPMIEVRKTLHGHEGELEFACNEIVFVLEGKIDFFFRDHPEKTVQKGQFFFIPTVGVFRYKAERKSMVLVIRLHDRIRLCRGMTVEQLYDKAKAGEALKKAEAVSMLDINVHLQHFLTGICEVLADGLQCRHYFETKTQELFFLLRTYYPREKLHEFFSLILTPDTAFSEYIRANALKYKTVGDFASALHMTPRQFSDKFNRVFRQAPYAWMKQEKVRMIQADLMQGEKDNKQIAHEYGFSTPNHLYDFCKENLGKTPGEIRCNSRIGEKRE